MPLSNFNFKLCSQQLATEALSNHDGASSLTTFDASNTNAWANYTIDYDSAGNETDQTIHWHNGTVAETYIVYDVANAYAWHTETFTYDSAGHQLNVVYA